MSVPIFTVSSKSCFNLRGRIIEERRRRLLPETVEMLACIKDWELGESRLQHTIDNQELENSFKNLYLDDDAVGAAGIVGAGSSGAGAGTGSSGLVHLGLVHLGLGLLVVNLLSLFCICHL